MLMFLICKIHLFQLVNSLLSLFLQHIKEYDDEIRFQCEKTECETIA